LKHPRKIEEFKPSLTVVERKVVEDVCAGELCVLGDRTRPDVPSVERNVRASVIRFLALGGSEDFVPHQRGVQLEGANVIGEIDLELCKGLSRIALFGCNLSDGLTLRDTSLDGLFLNGSVVSRRLDGTRISITGDLSLNDVSIKGCDVLLSGAEIGGQFSCRGGRFESEFGFALNAQNAVIQGAVFLDNGFFSKGEVNFSGARIGGQLVCLAAHFENAHGYALNAQDAMIRTHLIWRNVNVEAGKLNLMQASADVLVDDLDSWPEAGFLIDGFVFDKFLGSDLDVTKRLEWLEKNDFSDGEFKIRPYQQIAKVYDNMGHGQDRREVLFEMENRRRAWQFEVSRNKARNPFDYIVALYYLLKGWVARFTFGYGYRPERLLVLYIPLILGTALIAKITWDEGSMTPAAAPIIASKEWQDLSGSTGSKTPGNVWAAQARPGQDYETRLRQIVVFGVGTFGGFVGLSLHLVMF